MSQYSSYMRDKDNTRSYPTPDNTQPLTNSNLPRTPGTLQSSQSNSTQIVGSFLSDVPQGSYSEYSSLDNLSTIPTIIQDLAPHTPESLLYSPALDVSQGEELTELNSRKKQPILRRSPRISSNQTPQTSERQSDSTSLKFQDGSNNRELINKNPAALALKVLNESTDLQQLLSEQEMNMLESRNLNNLRIEQEFSTSLVDTENRDINELRDLITTSNMILDSVHHSSASYKNQEVDDEMRDIEYTHEQLQKGTNGTFKQPQEVSRSELEIEHENENEYSENAGLIIANEISDTLLRQSEHYNTMASKFSHLKFIKVASESEEEIEQFTTSITPGIRRSTRKRTTANYSYPRYSYGGSSSRRSKTRKRSRSIRKGSLSATKNKVNVEYEPVYVDNERNEEINELVHNLSPIEEQEANEYSHDIQSADDSGNVDENILDNESQSNLYLKHDLRSRKILLELPEIVAVAESEETEEEPVASPSEKTTRPKQLAKKPILKATSKKSAKTIPKRRTSRRSTSRKKNEDREWRPDDDDDKLGDDIEEVTTTPRSRRVDSKTRSTSKASTTPKKVTIDKNVKSIDDVIPTVSNTKRISSKKATPKVSEPPRTTRKGKKPAQSNRGRGKSRGGITRGSRSKNRDNEYRYSGGEETESEVEIAEPISEVVDTVDDNSENHIIRDAEIDDIQDEIEQNAAVAEETDSTPARPKRSRKSNRSPVSEPLINTPKSSRSTRSRDGNKRSGRKNSNTQVDDDAIRNIYEPLGNESVSIPEIRVDLVPPTQPKKKTRRVRSKGRGGKAKGRGGHAGGNTSTDQPIVPISDPCIVEVSSGNAKTLENALRVLSEKNYDILHSPGNITSIDAPVFVKPATRSTSLSSTPPPESQTIQTQPSSHNTPDWSVDHWRYLRVFYNETKNEYLRSGKVVTGSEAIYREVTKKFYDADINNRTFGEEILRNRIIALETADSEKNSEPSGSNQRRSSIESSSSRGSRSSVSRYNRAYSNLRKGTKRKRSASNATATPEGKKEDSNKEDGETQGKVSKRHRVEENTPSGSDTTTPSHDANIPQTSLNNNSIFSRLFGWMV